VIQHLKGDGIINALGYDNSNLIWKKEQQLKKSVLTKPFL
jgi:hypothetical protein